MSAYDVVEREIAEENSHSQIVYIKEQKVMSDSGAAAINAIARKMVWKVSERSERAL